MFSLSFSRLSFCFFPLLSLVTVIFPENNFFHFICWSLAWRSPIIIIILDLFSRTEIRMKVNIKKYYCIWWICLCRSVCMCAYNFFGNKAQNKTRRLVCTVYSSSFSSFVFVGSTRVFKWKSFVINSCRET